MGNVLNPAAMGHSDQSIGIQCLFLALHIISILHALQLTKYAVCDSLLKFVDLHNDYIIKPLELSKSGLVSQSIMVDPES